MLELGFTGEWIKDYLNGTRGLGWERPPHDRNPLLMFFSDCLESLDMSGLNVSNVRLVVTQSPYARVETIYSGNISYIVYDQAFREILHLLNKEYLHARKKVHSGDTTELDHTQPPPWWIRTVYANRFLAVGRRNESFINAMMSRDAEPSIHFSELSRADIDQLASWEYIQEAFVVAHELAHCRINHGGTILASGLASSFDGLLRDFAIYADKEADYGQQFRSTFEAEMHSMVDDTISELRSRNDHSGESLSWLAGFLRRIHSNVAAVSFVNKESLQDQLNFILDSSDEFGQEVLCDYFAMYFVTALLGDKLLPFDDCIFACHLASLHIQTWRFLTALLASMGTMGDEFFVRMMRESLIRHRFLVYTGQFLCHYDHLDKLYKTDLDGEDFTRAQDERKRLLLSSLTSCANLHAEWIHNRAILAVDHTVQYEGIIESNDELCAIVQSPDLPDMIAAASRIGDTKFSW